MTKLERTWLVAILLLSALLGFWGLTSGHNWAYSDFSAYIMQAESILQSDLAGFIAHNSITIFESDLPVGPIAYPWGYPLLLAPIIALMGISTLSMKLLNTLLYCLFLATLFFLFRKRLPRFESFALLAIFAFNPIFLQAQDYILSDLAFLFFSTFAIFFMDRLDAPSAPEKSTNLQRILVGGAIFVAFLTRTNGLLLLPSLVVYEIFSLVKRRQNFKQVKEYLPSSLISPLIFLGLWGLSSLFLPDGQASHLAQYENFHFSQLWDFLIFYAKLGVAFFAEIPGALFLYFIFIIFFFVGIIFKFKENFLFLLYFFSTLLAYLSWPHLQGIRFLFPILPIFIYVAAQGVRKVLSQTSGSSAEFLEVIYRGVLVYAALTMLFFSAQQALNNLANDRAIHGPFDEVSIDIFEYIKKTIPEDSRVIFFKPRVMRLMTERDSILVLACENLTNGDYVVVNKKWEDMGQIAPEKITACPVPLTALYKNRRFILYEIGDLP
ncbi:MAG: phospholipid carrier-dependent glycosyltransferase [Anaerolineae bacterium]|jgi:hypothetical protein|nr:phospholipid carrier-dependent glycosyltransferase [Anaerolineae bacterium]MBT7071004.1 phospholipid carrier-dependent glycosyltransferase [Anaerolineae bacterium]MBT7325806.1 phospholipid carrier-dependent glycosyltransferase [Anaerolineae bacterium]